MANKKTYLIVDDSNASQMMIKGMMSKAQPN
jgi:hypothetical protein